MAGERKLNKVETIITRCLEKGELKKDIGDLLVEKSTKPGSPIFLIVHKHHEVSIGEVKEKTIHLECAQELTPMLLKELRMFSKNGELYIWKYEDKFNYRLRIDEEKEGDQYIYDEEHFMWCDKPGKDDDYTVYETNRGMRLKLPFPIKDESKLPLKYLVRNYLTYDENGLIHFYDARLMTFLDANGEELENV
jgi:CRISPR-associated protein (TIGR03984 family)